MNRIDSNFVYCFGLDSSTISIIDIRSPAVPVASLSGHTSATAAQWSPTSASHIMVSDQSGLAIWDLKSVEKASWYLDVMDRGSHPVQFVWNRDHIAYSTSNELCLTKI